MGEKTYRVLIRFLHYSALTIWSLLNPITGSAEAAHPSASPSIFFHRLTTAQGLTNNNVNDLLQDRLGLIWFATDDGLNRFDGYELRTLRHIPGDENSLADNSIWALLEDRSGKIWLGTKSGIVHCYDPSTETFKKWELKINAVKDNTVTTLYEHSQGAIWIGTYRGGLYRLDPAAGKIAHWSSTAQDPTTLSSNYVTSIAEDQAGDIWVGTYHGLNRLPLRTEGDSARFIRYFAQKGNPQTLSDDIVWNLTKSEFDPGILWVGTAEGLTVCRPETGLFTQIRIPNPDHLQFGGSAGSVIEEMIDGERILWIDSFAGLIRCNWDQKRFERFVADEEDPRSLAHNHINGMIRDRSGVLWVATEKGVCRYPSKSIKFNNIPSQMITLRSAEEPVQNMRAIVRTGDGRMWFGTEKGLYSAERIGTGSSSPALKMKKYTEAKGLNIWSLAAGGMQDLWIGTYGSGLFRLDLKTNRLQAMHPHDKKITIPAIKYNKALFMDNQNRLWMGFWGLGLARLDPVSGEYRMWLHDEKDPLGLSHNDVWVIFQDNRERLWIGTNGGGLNLFSPEGGGRFTHWFAGGESSQARSKGRNDGSLTSNSIYAICQWRNGKSRPPDQTVLWIGTSHGLQKFIVHESDPHSASFPRVEVSSFTTQDGLANNSVKAILEDENGHLWLGTAAGISFFDTQEGSFINYDEADGVCGADFNYSSAWKDESGTMLMGSTSGLNCFEPRTIFRSHYQPPVLITDFQIFNSSVRAHDPALEGNKSILYAQAITLSHRQNVFSFQLAALDYNAPSSIEYAYQMEGFDADWVYGGTRRFITYTNLNPGRYLFKAKSTNSDGVWSDRIVERRVIITPPWWQTGWALLFYLLMLFGSVYGIVRFQAHRNRTQTMLRMQELEFNHLRQVENMKSRFFANLSHEFRTPLTLIKGPLEQLMNGRIKSNPLDYYRMLYRNAEKLQRLIDQLLELSQLEAETISLRTEPHDLVCLLQGLIETFRPLSGQKKIAFVFRSPMDALPALIDRDKFEKIINNLLSNAFKFTPVGGRIAVELRCEQKPASEDPFAVETAVVSIIDSGIGIPEQDRQNIFNRFFQVDDSVKRGYGGSGIGLALVKELVTLHQWEISVAGEEGKGSTFILRIPVHEPAQNRPAAAEQPAAEESENDTPVIPAPDSASVSSSRPAVVDHETAGKSGPVKPRPAIAESPRGLHRPKILIVEDSADVRFFLADQLSHEFDTEQADTAQDGIGLAVKTMPDLILSDVMMPVMDGIEFCHRLKSDWQTSHIPVILLTAKALADDKIKGLETGADDYITKPFNMDELVARIKNLIDQRKRLRDRIKQELNLQPEALATNSIDKEFMEKLLAALEENLADENFDSERLAQKLFVSRSRLHRKLRALTGQAPGEFIRMYKLKRAAQMLVENRVGVTQIAYEVGFGSPAQFTRAFKKYFSCLPSEFSRRTTPPL